MLAGLKYSKHNPGAIHSSFFLLFEDFCEEDLELDLKENYPQVPGTFYRLPLESNRFVSVPL